MHAKVKSSQIRLRRESPGYYRATFDNPPLNLMGAGFVLEIREVMNTLEADEQAKVVRAGGIDVAPRLVLPSLMGP